MAVAACALALVTTAGVVLSGSSGPVQAQTTQTKHFITNLRGSTAPFSFGYNVADRGAYPSLVNALPTGVQALVWLGQKCPTPADSTFKAKVDALVGNPKVFGYYLSDEPHIADCPGGPAALASRADYIRRATGGKQRSFIVLSRVVDFKPFAPANSHVDLVGLDPYPCSIAHPECDLTKIGARVSAAQSAGISLGAIVPVYQAFGQERTDSHYYNLPTATQEKAMLAEWKRLVPAPVLDYTYGWGNQSSSNPTLVDTTALQKVFASFFAS
ncbi:MAG TPA: hypothetical protein VGJ44_19655 [Kribbellaceae bacterium]